jgi:hypothetical protein
MALGTVPEPPVKIDPSKVGALIREDLDGVDSLSFGKTLAADFTQKTHGT